ncbi:hypothetical protein [Acetobacter lambici]|uniref:Uncharacterized protein n=1 Tax=Acetobacter lambici TaxID=1332824 RepID=A0ABT1F0C8_9PROT|nr:hypothetical protein [Acetobacter lambici]MCP1258667.1 hypothetical protein [Acetobacter lambici]
MVKTISLGHEFAKGGCLYVQYARITQIAFAGSSHVLVNGVASAPLLAREFGFLHFWCDKGCQYGTRAAIGLWPEWGVFSFFLRGNAQWRSCVDRL